MASTWLAVTHIRARISWKGMCPEKRYIMNLSKHFCKSHIWENEGDWSRSRSSKTIYNSNLINWGITVSQSQHLAVIFMRRGESSLCVIDCNILLYVLPLQSAWAAIWTFLWGWERHPHPCSWLWQRATCAQGLYNTFKFLWGKERKKTQTPESWYPVTSLQEVCNWAQVYPLTTLVRQKSIEAFERGFKVLVKTDHSYLLDKNCHKNTNAALRNFSHYGRLGYFVQLIVTYIFPLF